MRAARRARAHLYARLFSRHPSTFRDVFLVRFRGVSHALSYGGARRARGACASSFSRRYISAETIAGPRVVHLGCYSEEQRASVVRGFELCAALAVLEARRAARARAHAAARAGAGDERSRRREETVSEILLARALGYIGIESGGGTGGDGGGGGGLVERPRPGRTVSVMPGTTGGGGVAKRSALGNLLRGVGGGVGRGNSFKPNYHHYAALPVGTVVELAFSESYVVALPRTANAARVDAAVANADEELEAEREETAEESGRGRGARAAARRRAARRRRSPRTGELHDGVVVGTLGELGGIFEQGQFVLGKVARHDAESDTYIISFKTGPFDADEPRTTVTLRTRKVFPPDTRFVGVRREHLRVDYSEQRTRFPAFLLAISIAQIAVAYVWCARHAGDDNGVADDDGGGGGARWRPTWWRVDEPLCGPPNFFHQTVGRWPGCEDQRREAWRLVAYQFVHAGYGHLGGNVLMQASARASPPLSACYSHPLTLAVFLSLLV